MGICGAARDARPTAWVRRAVLGTQGSSPVVFEAPKPDFERYANGWGGGIEPATLGSKAQPRWLQQTSD